MEEEVMFACGQQILDHSLFEPPTALKHCWSSSPERCNLTRAITGFRSPEVEMYGPEYKADFDDLIQQDRKWSVSSTEARSAYLTSVDEVQDCRCRGDHYSKREGNVDRHSTVSVRKRRTSIQC